MSPPSTSRIRSTVACVPRTYFFSSLIGVSVVTGSENTINSRGPSALLPGAPPSSAPPSPSPPFLSFFLVFLSFFATSAESPASSDEEGMLAATMTRERKDRSVAPNGSL